MANSLRNKIKHFCYKGELSESERDRLLNALDDADRINSELKPCEDCISREEALKVMCDKCPMYNCVTGCSSYRHIEKMPSATPEPFINKPCISEGVCREDKIKVLDKIRAEIMQLEYDEETVDYDHNDMPQTEIIHTICREEVLHIIDKYKAESEE